jgi:hydrogenase maturation protein HypF
MIVDVTARIARQTGIRRVALTGGVFQNARLSSLAAHGLAQGNLDVLLHRRVPCNDGGLALGQALQAIRVVRAGQVAEDRRVCV